MSSLRVAAVQAAPVLMDRDATIDRVAALTRTAANDGAELPALAAQIRARIGDQLRKLGIAEPQIAVEPCAAIERPAGGKLPLVIADPRPRVMA